VSTIITTSLDLDEWYELFEKKHLVDALLDRLRRRCISINIDDGSVAAPGEPAASARAKPMRERGRFPAWSRRMTRVKIGFYWRISDFGFATTRLKFRLRRATRYPAAPRVH
jgi:hypothetical protein